MRIFIDSVEIEAVRQALDTGFVAGVTTNPTLLRRAGMRAAEVSELARQALAAGAQELHLQVYASDTTGMVAEARRLNAVNPERVVVKIPATPEGYRAAGQLSRGGVRVTLTAVYTLPQALLAQNVGASYIAIYLGRMRDAGVDALGLAEKMQALLNTQRAPVTILAASIRNVEEVTALGMMGLGAATLPPMILQQLLESDATARAAAMFHDDARAILE